MSEEKVVISVENLSKLYPIKQNFFQSLTSKVTDFVHAVDGLSFKIHKGETLGLVGESGCGKSTTGYLTLNLLEKTDGTVRFMDIDIHSISKNAMRKLREKMQIIFQNPYDSLSPRFTIVDIIAEPLRLLNVLDDEKEIFKRIKEIMEQVGLTPAEEFMDRFPHELSGGQRQRVGVARAFVLNPEYVVADEPVSMLDVSLRIGVLRIMKNLINTYGTAFLFITHDLALARYMCDRIAVMYLGMIVEKGPSEMVTQTPKHPYTRALITAVPNADPNESAIKEIPIIGEISDGIYLPVGCRFEYRCIYAQPKCAEKQPELVEIGKNHFAACIRISEIDDLVAMGEMPTKETPKDEPAASSTGS
ncbi:MAG: ABC transporter ATP-binding protein [Candidatus Heimdallarchaeota archaeon]|nr:ABC transporter ATP-binding protein [Candidatus Heimdallarchaeota archaeon]